MCTLCETLKKRKAIAKKTFKKRTKVNIQEKLSNLTFIKIYFQVSYFYHYALSKKSQAIFVDHLDIFILCI